MKRTQEELALELRSEINRINEVSDAMFAVIQENLKLNDPGAMLKLIHTIMIGVLEFNQYEPGLNSVILADFKNSYDWLSEAYDESFDDMFQEGETIQ